MKIYSVFCLFMLLVICTTADKVKPKKKDELKLYKKLFKVKRKEHIAAVQKLILEENIEKKAKLIWIMLDSIIKVITSAQKSLESENIVFERFPEDLHIKDELAKVLENTAIFTDIFVRFPKLAHGFYKKNSKVWKRVMEKAIEICNNTGVYQGDHQMILTSLQQELGIGEVDPNYVNPFRTQDKTPEMELTAEERQKLYKTAKMKKKMHDRKTKRTGPKLSKQEL